MDDDQLSLLLAPISEEHPCGENLYDDQALGYLFSTYVDRGTGGVQEGMAEGERKGGTRVSGSAAWRELESELVDAFKETKHLQMAWFLLVAETRLYGLKGMEDGLLVFTQIIERFWDSVHPQPEGEDLSERIDILALMDDDVVAESVENIPISAGRQAGSFTLGELQAAREHGDGDLQLIEKSIEETMTSEPTFYDQMGGGLDQVRAGLDRLAASVADHAPNATVPLDKLRIKLDEIGGVIAPLREGGGAAGTGEAGGEGSASESGPGGVPGIPGAIRSRKDVEEAIDRIIVFYRKYEPTSPVPLMLQRAKKLVGMDFQQIVQELNLSGNPPIEQVLSFDLPPEADAFD